MEYTFTEKDEKRLITLEGSFNFRDLGGYKTKSGRTVKWGRVFRSGDLSKVTANDLKKLEQLGIKTICDLRSQDEVEKMPDPLLANVRALHVPVIPNDDETMVRQVGDLAEVQREWLTNPGDMLTYMNKKMVIFAEAYKTLFRSLLNYPEEPLLFHCAAGKDRTGVVAALILSLLDIDRETILEDYLLTNLSKEKMRQQLAGSDLDAFSHLSGEAIEAMLEPRAEYIEAFFVELEHHYGTVKHYFERAIGLTEDEMNQLRENLLEP
ncbi:hypothetical protein AJ85_06960 [Alkalihalobacillus alcalophilus ATCC 27647 = CGMCC 1.3604]|uniref:Tyrosine specific protein phosphatases domain-containing protein n=1 Tax=Alkalihalobacillus alcalophilus ATCC 27647 = CGMCC 1.3604 TaxID=1218173 RepID=A0A4S4K0J2_ALKAL|nr:tyrosine-protein phosphatase [Alkalihalobacillus alcalophilus]MED1564168.1 tyrosine-protein phosphatase [Alkalihalobacillus alcalophilus]THG91106.1 hypothetical protein AJ85_06960 [Alkalihalobacillus alcalophilus ATCC 27647 = CGMCC 1.3604]